MEKKKEKEEEGREEVVVMYIMGISASPHRGTPAVAAEFGTQTSTVYQICCIGEAIGTTCPKI
jgi:hypothetical protein